MKLLVRCVNSVLFRRFQSTQNPRPLCMKLEKLCGQEAGITLLRLNRPEARNAISSQFLNILSESIDQIERDENCRVVIVKSDVTGCFCAGADLKERATLSEFQTVQFVRRTRGLIHKLSNLSVPVIAALDGVALGGGLELALACDIRVGSSSAKLGLVETKLAIIPGAGGTQRLPRTVGSSLAKELIFTGRILDGREAYRLRILNHLTERGQETYDEGAFLKSLEIAREILPQGPVAIRAAKKAINAGFELDLNSGLMIEDLCYSQVIPTKDRLEGLRAFKEKRPPKFLGE